MRLPQQQSQGLVNVTGVRPVPLSPDERSPSGERGGIRPAFGAPGMEECYERCMVLPPGARRDACVQACI
jgi:hypothetical protein